MFETTRTTSIATTRTRALATSTRLLKGCSSLGVLLLFLLGLVTNAFATIKTTTTLSASPTSAPVGSSVTLTATVSPAAATGTVTFKNGTTTLGTCTLSSGSCHAAFTTLNPGSNSLEAAYAGNGTYAASTSPDPVVTMTAVTTTTALKIGLAATPNTAITSEPYGTNVTLTATVTGTSAAGTVAFTYGTTPTTITGCSAVAVSSGSATCTTALLPVAANESLRAAFTATSSSAFTNSSNATAVAFAVTQVTTTTALKIGLAATPGSAITSEPFGTNVTLAATVTGTGAAGTVGFTYGTTPTMITGCGAMALSSGTATCTTSALPVAANESLKAAFTPTTAADYAASSTATATAYAVTTATMSSSLTAALTGGGGVITSAASGANVTLTANVTPSAVAVGTVTFKDTTTGATLCNAVAMPSGSAACATAALTTSGSNSLSAVFTPTTPANFSTATSTGTLAFTVTKPAASAALAVSPSTTHYYGASVTLTANVTPSAATGGTVTFSNGSTCVLVSGTCSASTTTLPLGSNSLTATYAGDSTYAASSASTAVPVSVVANPTAVAASAYQLDTTIPLAGAAVVYGTGFTLSATVTASGSVTPSSGHVSFYDSSTLLGYVAVNGSGVATLDSTSFNSGVPATGKHYYIASYGGVYSGGAAEFSTSLSSSAPVTVSQPTPLTITASSPSVTYGSPVPAITASYTGYVAPDTGSTLTTATKQPICTTAYTAASAVGGTYPSSCSSAVDTNYTITYATGLVTVTGLAPTWSNFNATTVTYGTAVPLAATTNSGGSITYTISTSSHGGTQTTISSVPATYAPGTYYVTATVAANGNYATATTQRTVTVNPAPLTITAFSPSSIAFGSAVPTLNASNAIFSGFIGSDSQSSLTGTLTCTTDYSTISPPATYSTSCKGLTSNNYTITYVNGSFVVTTVQPTITWPTTAGPITYGRAQTSSALGSCSATFNGSAVAGSCAWTTPGTIPHVGAAQSVTWTPSGEYASDYAPTTNATLSFGNVTAASLTSITPPTASSIAIGAALSASKLSGGSVTFTLPATSAVVSVPGTFSWATTSVVPAVPGTSNVEVSFTPTGTNSADYSAVENAGNASLTVTKATAAITTWPTSSSINYGQTLGNSNLSGGNQGALTGSFAWATPTAVPAVGTDSESVVFTPTGTSATLYTNATHTVSVVVNREAAIVSNWPTASSITYGQALSNSVLSGGTTSPSGRFTWSNPTNVPDAGGPAQNVTFTPTNNNYNPVLGTVNVTVIPATPTVSVWPTASSIAFGLTLDSSNLSGGDGSVAGNFVWTDTTVEPVAGTTSNSVTFTPNTINGMADYSNVIGWVNVVVNPCGLQDSTNSAYSTALSVYNLSENPTPALPSPVVMDVEGINQSAICAINASASDTSVSPTTVTYPFITSGAVSSYPADSNSNGTNAAVLAYGTVANAGTGATISIADDGNGDPGSISTSNNYSSGVFASMGGIVNINDTYVSTSGNFARALDATYEGTLNISNVQASTTGNNSAVIAAGVGGGNVTVDGGLYTTNGTRSAGIRVAGTGSGPGPFSTVTVTDADASTTIMAQNSDAVVIEGGNAVSISSTGGGIALSGALGDNHGIFLYQGTLGDATIGTGSLTMNGGSISYACDETSGNGNGCIPGTPANDQNVLPTLFSVSNTTAAITLTDVTVTNDTLTNSNINGTLLTVAALSNSGGTATFNANGEILAGDVIVDATSAATVNLVADTNGNPSILTGAINAANSGVTVNLSIDATSSWVAADGPSYVTAVSGAGTANITCQHASACQVYVAGVLQAGIN